MNHLTDEQLSAYMDGAFRGRDAEEAGRHLAGCQPCREALAELAEQDAALKPALKHDPGEAYFESFASRVEDRIRSAAPSRAPAAGFDLGRWFRSPRALAWAGGAAVVVVGGGIALMTTREVTPPDLRARDGMTQMAPAAPGEAKTEPGAVVPPPAATATPSMDDAAPGAPSSGDLTESPGAAQEGMPIVTSEREALAKSRADAPAPSPVAATGADEVARVRKKLAAQPMDAAKRAATGQALGATGAREESAAREYSFAQPPPARSPSAPRTQEAPDLEGEARLCGDVRDAAGRPVAGAQVTLTDLGRAATTDAAGRFCLRAPHGEHALSVMAVGYRESRQVVRVAGAEAIARVTLAPVAVLDPRGGSVAGRAPAGPPKTALPTVPTGPPATQVPGDAMDQAKDAYAPLPDTVRGMVREARRLEAEAAARGSAAHFDFAAAAWGRVLARVMGGPLEIETRRHVAETRYRAWEAGPGSRRARTAIEALTAYVTRAPAGAERDQAIRWLDRVRP